MDDTNAHRRDPVPWRREGIARLAAALVALALAGASIVGTDDFPLDDAWIHLSYAKSLRLGDGLSYNPGDWETGFSSPLWAVLLAIWPTSGEPVLAVKLLGALLHAATAWFGAELVLRLVAQRATVSQPLPALSMALLGGAFVASTPVLLQGATSGMEVPLAAMLVLAHASMLVAQSPRAAAITGALAVWARPEALIFVVALGGGLALARLGTRAEQPEGFRTAIAGPIAAALALGAWVLWNLAVSGYPWPNTQYIKGTGGGLAGLAYLRDAVLPWQPWVVSLTGTVAVALAVLADVRQRRWELVALIGAMVVTWVAIAVSRPLHPGVGFYESRYFAPFAALALPLLPLGLAGRRRLVAWVLVLPVAGITGLQIVQVRDGLVAQSRDTALVHTAVARSIATDLPANAIVAVEGAGAIRFFAPRTMTIVDLVGLNDRAAAHLHHDRVAKTCHFVRRAPTHFAVPVEWLPLYSPPFKLRPLARFDDPHYTQVDPPRPLTVVLAAVDAVQPDWSARCARQ